MTAPTTNVLEHEIGPGGLLAIRLHSSDIRVRGVAGSVVRLHDATGTLERTVRIERAPGSLSLRADRGVSIGFVAVPIVGGRRAPNLDIEAPFGTTIVVETASGDVAADGLTGDQRYRTASGDIVLRSVSGQLTIDAVSGDVGVVTGGACAIAARTVSGDLSIRGDDALSSARLATTSGEIRLEGRFAGSGPYAVETVSGDTVLAPAGGLRLEVRTVTGDVRSEIEATSAGGRGARTVVVGAGGPTLTFRSISGDIRVVGPGATPAQIASASTLEVPARPVPPELPAPPVPPEPPTEPVTSDSPMAVLEALERGDIDVAEASRQLEAFDARDAEVTA